VDLKDDVDCEYPDEQFGLRLANFTDVENNYVQLDSDKRVLSSVEIVEDDENEYGPEAMFTIADSGFGGGSDAGVLEFVSSELIITENVGHLQQLSLPPCF
jgi:hypothetical protein